MTTKTPINQYTPNPMNQEQNISLLNINLSNARAHDETYPDYRARLKLNKQVVATYRAMGREAFQEMYPTGVASAITDAQAAMSKPTPQDNE